MYEFHMTITEISKPVAEDRQNEEKRKLNKNKTKLTHTHTYKI